MTPTNLSAEPIYSDLADDPDLGDIVRLYVDEMPGRIESLLNHFASFDWLGLAIEAHQLKGAAGSHGFHQLTPAAAALEQTARQGNDVEKIQAALDTVVELLRRIR